MLPQSAVCKSQTLSQFLWFLQRTDSAPCHSRRKKFDWRHRHHATPNVRCTWGFTSQPQRLSSESGSQESEWPYVKGEMWLRAKGRALSLASMWGHASSCWATPQWGKRVRLRSDVHCNVHVNISQPLFKSLWLNGNRPLKSKNVTERSVVLYHGSLQTNCAHEISVTRWEFWDVRL